MHILTMDIDDYLKNPVNRREAIRKIGKSGMVLSGAVLLEQVLSACGSVKDSISPSQQSPVIYPPLKGHKVQPPENGCYIGFHSYNPSTPDYYKRLIGVGPKIMLPQHQLFEIRRYFIQDQVEGISEQGAIPFVWREFNFEIGYYGFNNIVGQKEVTNDLSKYAQAIVDFGKPIFVSSMREMNGDWYPWGQNQRTFKNIWRYMWQIFEDTGANEYATWVWEIYCPLPRSNIDEPERYYPGDQYVDWIGLSTYSRTRFRSGNQSFSELTNQTYTNMRTMHSFKPIMMAEFGKTRESDQYRWLKDAFKTIKSLPGMKAAIFFNHSNVELSDDHTLTDESFAVYAEILKDPYFIGAK